MSDSSSNTIGVSDKQLFRFEIIPSLIAISVASLIAWGLSWIPSDDDIKTAIAIASGIYISCMLLTNANIGGTRSATVIKTTAWIFLITGILLNIILSVWCQNIRYIILTNALSILFFIAIAYSLIKSKQ